MRIQKVTPHLIPVNARGNWLFVRLHTDAGLVGTGEASHSHDDARCAALLRQMEEPLRECEPLNIRATVARLLPLAGDRAGQTALSAVEQALWDLLGQAAGMPVHQLLGGAVRTRIPLYANINRGTTDRTPAGFARRAEAALAAGFRRLKLSPFEEVQRAGSFEGVAAGLERLRAVRGSVGQEADVRVDCHCCFDVATALKVAEHLAGIGVTCFEDPVPRDRPDLLRQVKEQVPLTIAAGQSFFGLAGFTELLTGRLCDVVMPDVKHCGGIGEALRISAHADALGIAVSPHNPAGPVSTAASLHLCAVLPNFTELEYQWNEVPWRGELCVPGERVRDGCLEVPDGPGLGIRLEVERLDSPGSQ